MNGGSFGWSVGGAGDVDGDGFSDVLVGAPLASFGQGATFLYLGSTQGVVGAPIVFDVGGSSVANVGVVCAACRRSVLQRD